MKHTEDLLSTLKQDEIKNLNLIGFLEENSPYAVLKHGSSVLVKGKSDEMWIHISSENADELEFIISLLGEDDKYFASVEDWMIPYITKNKKADWILSTVRYYLPGGVTFLNYNYDIKPLRAEFTDFILANSKYKQFLTPEYINERIEKGISGAIYDNGKPAAWGLTHDDNSMGFLQVLPEYKNKGYGSSIVIYMSLKEREQGRIPFAHVEENNIPAIKLVEKLGFVKDRNISWIKMD